MVGQQDISIRNRSDSIGSFEEVKTKVLKASEAGFTENLRIDGRVPPILYVVNYVGWNSGIVECRQSDTPFKHIPQVTESDDPTKPVEIGNYGEEESERPVFDIVYTISVVKSQPPSQHRNNDLMDRPITAAFDLNDHRCEEYDPENELAAAVSPAPKPSMNIHSKYLIHALQAVINYYPGVDLEGDKITIPAPYRVLYHHREELAEYSRNQPKVHGKEFTARTTEHINVLLGFLEGNLGTLLKSEAALHSLKQPSSTFELFWLLLKPGSVFYAKRYSLWTPFVISSVKPGASNTNTPYKISCWMLESNGVTVKRFMESFTIRPWTGEQVLTSLPIIPERFWVEDLASQGGKSMREKCIEEGKLYWHLLKQPTYMEYDGPLVSPAFGNRSDFGVVGHLQGRVICDPPGFDRYWLSSPDASQGSRTSLNSSRRDTHTVPALDHLPNTLSSCGCEACKEDRTAKAGEHKASPYDGFKELDPTSDQPPNSDLFYQVLSNTIPGFVLSSRRWASLNVANLKSLTPVRDSFKDLVLDDEIKMTVKALIGKYTTSGSSQQLQPWNSDLVQSKGEGRIFLLHGTPGVGKTCTAECIAESSNRPLIAITSGDLGTESYRVENSLNYFLELGQRYGALLLLDEADVYLEHRRSKDIARNGLVSVFLRALEYYRGVLFLTTNRVQAFDTAFLSRIHVALHYKHLRSEDRERIWANSFERLERESNNTVRVSTAARKLLLGEETGKEHLRSLKWNGREIRNALQTMLALAESQAKEEGSQVVTVEQKHVRAVVNMNKKFQDYLSKEKAFKDVAVEGESSDED